MLHTSCILIKLSISQFQPKKTDKKVTAAVIAKHSADPKSGRFVKALLPEEAVEPIAKTVNEARTFHYEHTLPWADEGLRILPNTAFDHYMEVMRKYRQLFNVQVADFCTAYPAYIQQAKILLNDMFNADDYPGPDDVQRKFKWTLEPSPVPSGLDFRVSLHEEEMAELRRSVDQRVADAVEQARLDLYRHLAERLTYMGQVLSKPDKKFKDSLITNTKRLLDIIPSLNITKDADLERIRQEALAALQGIDGDILRDNPAQRKQTAEAADAILAKMQPFMK